MRLRYAALPLVWQKKSPAKIGNRGGVRSSFYDVDGHQGDRAVNRTFSISVNGIVKIPICFKTDKKKSKTKCQMVLELSATLKDSLEKTLLWLTWVKERLMSTAKSWTMETWEALTFSKRRITTFFKTLFSIGIRLITDDELKVAKVKESSWWPMTNDFAGLG